MLTAGIIGAIIMVVIGAVLLNDKLEDGWSLLIICAFVGFIVGVVFYNTGL